MKAEDLKVALVCDWLTDIGGAELVLFELHQLFPDAPIYTSQYNPKKINWFDGAAVRTGWLQYFPAFLKKLLPVIRAFYFSRLDLSEYDLVISSSGAEAKAVKTSKNSTHICYMHAPNHYYWSRYEDYIREPGWGYFNWLGRAGLKLLVGPMRKWDFRAAQKPGFIITNSGHTQKAVEKYYNRTSTVIHPPVDVDFFGSDLTKKRHGFVITGRQTPYKRVDLAVQACTELSLPLTVVGSGPEHRRLLELAGPTIKFKSPATRQDVRHALQGAEAFIFPGLDDFGIAPVEALASGTAVIAYMAGGALDYVVPGKTGIFFEQQTVDVLKLCLQKFDPATVSGRVCHNKATEFSPAKFRHYMQEYIASIRTDSVK